MTALAGAPLPGGGVQTCFGVGGGVLHPWPSGSDPRVYHLDENNHLIELAWVGGWVHNDVTAITGAPPAQITSPVTCFGMGGSGPRVYYLDSNNHVNELAWVDNWVHTDVTAITGAPASKAAPTPLTCFGVGGSDPSVSGPRVYYVDSNNHVNELAWAGGVRRWVHSDVTALAGGPSPVESLDTGLTCFGVGGSDPRVYYLGSSDGHVNELAWVGNRWVNSNLAALTGAPPASH